MTLKVRFNTQDLAVAMLTQGVSIPTLAAQTNLSSNTIRRAIRGENLKIETFNRIATALNMDISLSWDKSSD